MKKMIALFLALGLTASLAACGSSGDDNTSNPTSKPSETAENTPAPTPEPKEEETYKITYSNVKTYTNSIGTAYAQVIVEIENTGTVDLYLSSGSYDLEDENGKLIASSSMASTYPEVISPGEKAYMYEENMLDETVDGNLTVLPRPDVKKAKVENIRYGVTDVEISSDKYGFIKAMGRVENTTSEDEDGMIYVVVILKDASGTPIGQIFTIITDNLVAGDKMGFEASGMSLPDDVTVDSIASYDAFAYPMQMQF